MTRVLSELLGADPHAFRLGLDQLESASGHDNVDIRLSAELTAATQRKLRELGLDPHDTTGPELYRSLQVRLKADDERLVAKLRERYGKDDIANVASVLSDLPFQNTCFALKSTAAKRLLKKSPPKHAMKALGYRSFDSMLKHEPLGAVYAAAQLTESQSWQRQLSDQYKKLSAADFEIRPMAILSPDSAKWHKLAESHVAARKHNLLGLAVLGAIVLLPLPEERPPAAVLTSLLLALQKINELRSSSTFLKLCQVKPDFGEQVYQVATSEPTLPAQLFGRAVPWQIIQRYYARFTERFKEEVFAPHVQADDLSWLSIEKVLSYIDPQMEFWHYTTHLSLLHDHRPVSCNIVDVALNYCNQLEFSDRIVNHFRHSLWHELIIRYLKHENVEQLVLGGLETELVPVGELE